MTDRLVRFDGDRFARSFGREAFPVEHELEGHPLLSQGRLAQLARTLPDDCMEWNAGDVGLVHDPASERPNGLCAAETVERIDACGSWIVLKRIERDPEYAGLLARCLSDLDAGLAPLGERRFRTRGFIFLSSPGAVTPLHLDPELNFLLQVRGSKAITVYDRGDRGVVREADLERFAAGGHRNVAFDLESQEAPVAWRLAPGDGVHVPLHAPHVVQNGDDVSISLSVTFQTQTSDAERAVLLVNHRLRQLGLSPRAYGGAGWSERVKHALVRSVRGARGLLRAGR
ncbi:MAG: transcriptional regulator [Planctomycetota bacterium]